MGAENIKPYSGDDRAKGEQVREMFDSIAPAYDFMNRAMTLGIDKRWRRKAVEMVAANYPTTVLDIASGTGDLAIMLAEKLPAARITGIDLSQAMIDIGNKKLADKHLSHRVELQQGDCLNLPYADSTFDCITVAYGVRNFEDLARGYSEMLRVLRPGGFLCVIELSTPTSKLVKPFYHVYTRYIIPVAGRIVSKDVSAYSYLPESIAAVPQGAEMAAIISAAGFQDASFVPLTFGVCTIYTAYKPLL